MRLNTCNLDRTVGVYVGTTNTLFDEWRCPKCGKRWATVAKPTTPPTVALPLSDLRAVADVLERITSLESLVGKLLSRVEKLEQRLEPDGK